MGLDVLRRLGGEYALLAQRYSYVTESGELFLNTLLPLKPFTFKVKTITFGSDFHLENFNFEVATITEIKKSNIVNFIEFVDNLVFSHTEKHLTEVEQLIIEKTISNQTYEQIAASSNYSIQELKNVASNLWKVLSSAFGEKVNKTNLKNTIQRQVNYSQIDIHRSLKQAQYFIEDLGNGAQLEMVSIPEGNFIMGAPENEENSNNDERPQHQVNIQSFFMGKYPVTQAQWQAIASLPQVNRELNPEPSNFKGANRPVEQVSWYEAVEFCDRLSQHTGKSYRLPSEAEWEYACRAGTTTPFHFGETITSELANYDATRTYGAGVKGTYREETTEVGSFGVANAFGLYDMHGNVWEWCLDDWHSSYEGAPTNGSAWFDSKNDNLSQRQGTAMLRGGSWAYFPAYCRSASRFNDLNRDLDLSLIGFRVVCAVGRILR
ncbi:formylglycine-generating enzyme family protein [Nostoc sp. UHCC 0252]|uniref:formylglycine-generating enzyme family protein n=1 Tax=Nostoc sp. UHCC 0252 TaxID=3110241 RepID=UPI002B218710|nr:formylglycine-generating enzyme family protein [Nostoc sp. UHCC 0252]MEA5603192.1 formylglycine-generating enzyme family protein [Nostoc sp. UHCC 0252]